jgi:predicted glycosyltransferase
MIRVGTTAQVSLTINPRDHTVVDDDGNILIESDTILVSVGGGQPGFTAGKLFCLSRAAAPGADHLCVGVLTGSFSVIGTTPLSACQQP